MGRAIAPVSRYLDVGYMCTKELYIRFVVCEKGGDEAPCLRLPDYLRESVLERLLLMRRQRKRCARRVCLQHKLPWSTNPAAGWFLRKVVAYRKRVLDIRLR